MSRTTVLLLFVCLLAAIPMFFFGATYYIDYDGYWHVFIARLDWRNMLVDSKATAHPPLFFFLLKAVTKLGASGLVYRLVSILSGIGATFLIGQIAHKVTGSTALASLTAFIFGLSQSTLAVACEVRSYMLCSFFVLLSFYLYLDIVRLDRARPAARTRIGFIICSCLAILSHYSAAFFLFACLAAPVCMAALNDNYRARLWRFLSAEWRANVLTILPTATLGATLYWFQGRIFAAPLPYIAQYYFDPGGTESRTAFLLRTSGTIIELFSPRFTSGWFRFAPTLFALCGIAATIIYYAWFRSSRNILADMTVVVFLLMLGGFMAASLLGRYPFGGELRHQFLLFPFLVLSIILFLDRLATLTRLPQARAAALLLGAVAGSVNAKMNYNSFPNIRADLAAQDMILFRKLFPSPDVVLLDQFNTIIFFTHYHDWTWRPTGAYGSVYRHEVSKNGMVFAVARDNSIWNFDFTEAHLYVDINRVLATTAARSVTVFCIEQRGSDQPHTLHDKEEFQKKVQTLSAQAGLRTKRLVVEGRDIFAEFVGAKGDTASP